LTESKLSGLNAPAAPAAPAGGAARGFIVAIGGDGRIRSRKASILRRFMELCGGTEARITVLSVGSDEDDSRYRYERAFRDAGARYISTVNFENRAVCNAESHHAALTTADGILLVGHDAAMLSETLSATPLARQIAHRNAQGMHVAGAGAGAAFLPTQMIVGGKGGTTPRADSVQLAPGLGLIDQLIIDQHFRHRDRLGRMLMALAYSPRAIGIGIDEDTAGFIGVEQKLHVLGSGGITVIDTSQLQHSAIHPDRSHTPVSMTGLHLDILVEGSVYDMSAHMASIDISPSI
jgi:cyanophycinase